MEKMYKFVKYHILNSNGKMVLNKPRDEEVDHYFVKVFNGWGHVTKIAGGGSEGFYSLEYDSKYIALDDVLIEEWAIIPKP